VCYTGRVPPGDSISGPTLRISGAFLFVLQSMSIGGRSVILRLTFDADVFFTGLIFTLLMGAVGGFIPSFNAMRLRPLESLK
jgi:ABC-type antimicrobial peptide transport system permease subunit